MAELITSWQNAQSGRELLADHVNSLATMISGLDLSSTEEAALLIDQVTQEKGVIYIMGNGGSAATALHMSTDLSWGRRQGDVNRPRAICLAANSPIMTALANDVSYDEVFTEQLINFFNEGDLLVLISASGNYENLLQAARFARQHGGRSIGIVGVDGGKLKAICDVSVHIPTPTGAYELVEDVHHAVCHMIANYLKFAAVTRANQME